MAEFRIVISNQGGASSSGQGGAARTPGGGTVSQSSQNPKDIFQWALDPQTGRAMTPAYMNSYGYREREAKQGGFLSQLQFGLSEAFSGGPTSAMQRQFALMGMGGAGSAIGSVAGASAAFGPVGVALAGLHLAFEGARKVVAKFTETVQYFVQRGETLQRYSGDVAFARATSQVRTIQGDIREAQYLGKNVAQITESQSKLTDEWRKLTLPFEKASAILSGAILEGLAETLKDINETIDSWGNTFDQVSDFFTNILKWAGAIDDVVLEKRRARKAIDEAKFDMNQAVNKLLLGSSLRNVGPAQHLDDVQKTMLEQRLNIPALEERQ